MIRSIKRSVAKRSNPLPLSWQKPWTGAAASMVMHGLVVAVFIFGTRQGSEVMPTGTPVNGAQQVSMVYLPPPPNQRRLEQPVSRPAPDAVQAQEDQMAQIRAQAPDLAPVPEDATPEPDPAPEKPPESMASIPPPPAAEEPTMESEAKRLFGRPRLNAQPDNSGQMGARLGNISERDEQARRSCVPKARDPNAQIEMAELIGRVWFDEAHTRPLGGAYLQMIGTPYSTYSDNTGRYRLVFDASLVDECRTQYVRVVAAGYSGKNLVLGLGPGVNDIVMGR